MTRGCLNGLKRKARTRVSITTIHICKMARGSAKSRGLSPWNTPLDVAFMAAGHELVTVALAPGIFFFSAAINQTQFSDYLLHQEILYSFFFIKQVVVGQ
jgi:hypothetical protein